MLWYFSFSKPLRRGFLVALQYTMRIMKGGLLFAGLPCSSHVWISRGTSKRSRADPRGDLTVDMTRFGNMFASRFGLICLICIVRSVFWACEQPNTSLAMYLHYLEHVLNANRIMLGFAVGQCQRLFLAWLNGTYWPNDGTLGYVFCGNMFSEMNDSTYY